MARPLSAIFTANGRGPSDFVLPDVHASDPLGAPLFPTEDYFKRPDDLVAGQKVIPRLNPEAELFSQVFGYVAPKRQCILDLDGPDQCWMVPPSPTNYEYAHQGSTILADATTIPTANIGGAGGHAPTDLGWMAVPRFYEDISTQMARVRYGEDEWGVYAVGVLAPELTWGGAVKMVASATSGDWRWVDELGAWDFMGSCFVNLPGLPLHAKSGTRKVRSASATPFGDKVMIVTMSANIEPTQDEEIPDVSGTANCNCKTAADAAAEAQVAATETIKFEVDDQALGLIKGAIDEAITANNAAWETKLGEAVAAATEPLATRLSTVEEMSLAVLDNV